ncbi:hypothetical protein [Azotobacter vinelandii]|uniref:hypothetical protein n=1 Tax=Azotobacter vinelandii TaxID=354 RepID=UPI0009E7A9CB|nr:hypothetical protein [Azotobacter vinelandii]WKN22361.1 multidrug transporter [Azotobacter vinelandii]
MPSLRPLALASTALLSTPPAHGTHAGIAGDPVHSIEAPPAFAMPGDPSVARPAGTPIGNVEGAGRVPLVEPGREAFVRCPGCTAGGYRQD